MYSARVKCRLEVNRKRGGDGDELSYVGYDFSLVLTVPRIQLIDLLEKKNYNQTAYAR